MKKSGRSSSSRTGSSSKSGKKSSFSKDKGGKRGVKRAYSVSSREEKPRFSSREDAPSERRSSRSEDNSGERPERKPYGTGGRSSSSFGDKRNSNDDKRKSYGESATKRPYIRKDDGTDRKSSSSFGDRRNSNDDRRTSSRDEAPKRPYNRGEGTSDRSKTSRSFDEKPKRAYTKRDDSRPSNDDRRKSNDDERPKRAYTKRDDSRPAFDDKRSTNNEQRTTNRDTKRRTTSRVGDKRVRKAFDEETPKRNYNRGEGSENRRTSFGRDITPDAEKPARKAFNDDAPKSEFDRSKRRSSSPSSFDRGARPAGRGDKPAGRSSSRDKNSFDKKPSFRSKSDDGGEFAPKKWNRKESAGFYGEKKKSSPARPKAEDDDSTRLNKFIANAGICSRREADEMIEAGVISVNGKVITEMGYKVQPDDEVKYNNETLRGERLVYILLNKPKDFITTTEDPEDRKTVMGLIAKACKERVYPVGRLDRNTTGVLLFTNDGDLARKLTHPSFQMEKVYQVELDRNLKAADMETIAQGIKLEDGAIKVDNILYAGSGLEKNVIGVELHSGKNRIVRRIFEHLEYEVKKLDRVIFAGLTKKDLPRGRWRFLTDMEIASLKMMTSKTKK